jgi:uncharacterized protein (TIGR03083 family)
MVPTCPDWDADDLLWHLSEVQWFWGTVVLSGETEREAIDKVERPERSADRDGLLEQFAAFSSRLSEALAAAQPDTPAWTWADDHTVGFIRRRQAHEALIHRVDAELLIDTQSPLDSRLSADGVDEALRVMYGGDIPAWGTFEPAQAATVRVSCTDTGDRWFARIGNFAGKDPDDGKEYDMAAMEVAEGGDDLEGSAEVTGAAQDLDCWLWRRPTLGAVATTGDAPTLERFHALIEKGVD